LVVDVVGVGEDIAVEDIVVEDIVVERVTMVIAQQQQQQQQQLNPELQCVPCTVWVN
jgi:hypothetical protein